MQRSTLIQSVLAGFLFLSLAIGGQFVRATYGSGGATPPLVVAAKVPEAERTRLRLVDGLPVARLAGSHYEIGRQHGVLFKEQIRFLKREYFEALAMPAVGVDTLRKWTRSVEPFVPDHLKEELRGIADGAGLTYEQVLTVNTMVDKLQSVMCSTVVATGDATVDGETYFGRNLDFPGRNILHKSSVVLVIEAKGKPTLVSVTWPGLVGVLSGMNEHGVAGATMMIHRGKAIRPGVPYMMMYREALTGAKKMADVHDSIAAAKRTCPNNFMVVDATGASEVLEFDQDNVARRPAESGCVCSTNHFRSEELENVGIPLGLLRYKTLDRFLVSEHGKIDLARIKSALKDVATPWFLNVQSMVFLPARREMHVAFGAKLPAAGQRWVHLDRATLFPK
ncbi:MAG: C45 family autoproteolytic acyltransferase/hydrolase [Planctomycetota bacterium]|jgi:predicted choloylglycine hydrolase